MYATDPKDGKGKTKPKTEVEKKADNAMKESAEKVDEKKESNSRKLAPTAQDQVSEEVADSTYNSVNKYNFILYFIYKYKYGSEAESLRNFLQ